MPENEQVVTPYNPISLLRMPKVTQLTGLSRSTIYRMVDRGEFPRPVPLTSRTVAWSSSEIDRWIQERLAGPRAGGNHE